MSGVVYMHPGFDPGLMSTWGSRARHTKLTSKDKLSKLMVHCRRNRPMMLLESAAARSGVSTWLKLPTRTARSPCTNSMRSSGVVSSCSCSKQPSKISETELEPLMWSCITNPAMIPAFDPRMLCPQDSHTAGGKCFAAMLIADAAIAAIL